MYTFLEKLKTLETIIQKWQNELDSYINWSMNNIGALSEDELKKLNTRQENLLEIKTRITQIVKLKKDKEESKVVLISNSETMAFEKNTIAQDTLPETLSAISKVQSQIVSNGYPTFIAAGNSFSEKTISEFKVKLDNYEALLKTADEDLILEENNIISIEKKRDEAIKNGNQEIADSYKGTIEILRSNIIKNRENIKSYRTLYKSYIPIHEAQEKQQRLLKTSKISVDGALQLDMSAEVVSFSKFDSNYYKSIDWPLFKSNNQNDFCSIDSNDISQGTHLGSCTVLAVLVQLAKKWPDAIQKAIQFKGKKKKGNEEIRVFSVRLYLKKDADSYESQKVDVLVTDEFYFSEETTLLSGKGDEEIWVMLIEKAVAALLGGYDILNLGQDISQVQFLLTGKPSNNQEIKDEEQLIELLQEHSSTFILLEEDNTNETNGGKHAYSIIDVNFDTKMVTVTESEKMETLTISFTQLSKRFKTISLSILEKEESNDCPENLQNNIVAEVKTSNSFLKMSETHQLELLSYTKLEWKDKSGVIYKVVSAEDVNNIVIFNKKSKKQQTVNLSFIIKDVLLQPVLADKDIEVFFKEFRYLRWIDIDKNEYSYLYKIDSLYEFEIPSGPMLLSLEQIRLLFGILAP